MKDPQHDLIAPRKWLDLFFGMNGWVAVIAAVALFFMTIISVLTYRNAARLAETSEVAIAIAISQPRNNPGEGRSRPKLSYQFWVESQSYQFTQGAPRWRLSDAAIGDTLEVYYWPEDPSVYELSKGETMSMARKLQAVALFNGLAAFGMLWHFGMRTNRGILARKKGTRTTATIKRISERYRVGQSGGTGIMEFQTDDGLMGQTLNHDISSLCALGEGTEIVVFERKGEVWWEGDVGPRESVPSSLPKVL